MGSAAPRALSLRFWTLPVWSSLFLSTASSSSRADSYPPSAEYLASILLARKPVSVVAIHGCPVSRPILRFRSRTAAKKKAHAGEQPVQHRRNRLPGILVDPGVIMGSMRPIYPASGLLAQKLERVQLLPGNCHWSCPSSGRVLWGFTQPEPYAWAAQQAALNSILKRKSRAQSW